MVVWVNLPTTNFRVVWTKGPYAPSGVEGFKVKVNGGGGGGGVTPEFIEIGRDLRKK